MPNPLLSQVALQNVHTATGSAPRLSALTVQAVMSSSPKSTRVSSLTLQAVTQSIAKGVRLTQLDAQFVLQNSTGGGITRVTENDLQVVYSVGSPFTDRSRAWTFTFDGHTMYVLDMGPSGALVYDQATEQWTIFETQGFEGQWNMKNGWDWASGKQVVAGDIETGTIRALDKDSFLDDDFRPVLYEVRGAVFVTDNRFHRQYFLRLQGSTGRIADPDTTQTVKLKMQFSDDQAISWSPEYEVVLQADARQRIEFRSLGAMTSPGRIFRLYDEGGIKFIAYCVANIEE